MEQQYNFKCTEEIFLLSNIKRQNAIQMLNYYFVSLKCIDLTIKS